MGVCFCYACTFLSKRPKKSHEFVSIYKHRPDLLIFYRGGGYNKKPKVSRQQKQKDRQASRKAATQSERACNMAASRTLSSPGKGIRNLAPPCEDASASPSGERARSGPTRVQSVVPAVWPVRRSFVLVEIERIFGNIMEKE